MSDDATKPRRKRRDRVHRKGPGRGWVFRWREFDRELQKTVRRTSKEYDTKPQAEVAEAAARDGRMTVKLAAKKRRATDALPIAALLERWRASRLALNLAGPGWAEEVVRTVGDLCALRRWRTVEDITAEAVDRWITDAGGVAVRGPLTALRSVLNYAYTVLRQPVDAGVLLLTVKRKRTSKAKPYRYDDHELGLLLGAADAQGLSVGTLARYIVLTGQRPKTVANITVGDWDEVNRLIAPKHNKNGEPLLVAIHDDDLAMRLSRLTAGRARKERLFLHPDGTAWTGKHDKAAKLSVWWQRTIGAALPRQKANGRLVTGLYILVDTAVSRMREAGWEPAAIAATTGKRTMRVHDLYDATTRDRLRSLWRRLPVLPMPVAAGNDGGQDGGHRGRESPNEALGADVGATNALPSAL